MDSKNVMHELKKKMEKEVQENILPFWMTTVIDKENGGFYGEIQNDLTINNEAPKCLILNTRLIWTYSAAYRIFKDPRYLETAQRAYDYFMEYFWDTTYGGAYYMVDNKGTPIDTKKFVYGQAFVIYALSEFYRATKHQNSLDTAITLFRKLEAHAYDKENQGYIEALDVNWDSSPTLYKSNINPTNGSKTMNTHLHILEAYTNLARIWPVDEMIGKLREQVDVMRSRILDNSTFHYKMFFTDDWSSLTDDVSFGHDIEGSWLLFEAAEVIKDKDVINVIKPIVVQMAEAVLSEGMDPDGSMLYEANGHGEIIDNRKSWWVQAEAVVGFFNAYELTKDQKFMDAAVNAWAFIETDIVDRENGDWFSYAHDRGNPKGVKVSGWKCPYHNARACFEMVERVRHKGFSGPSI